MVSMYSAIARQLSRPLCEGGKPSAVFRSQPLVTSRFMVGQLFETQRDAMKNIQSYGIERLLTDLPIYADNVVYGKYP